MGGTGNTELDILLVDILDVPEAGAASAYKEKIRLHYDCIFYAEKCNYLVLGNVVDFFFTFVTYQPHTMTQDKGLQ